MTSDNPKSIQRKRAFAARAKISPEEAASKSKLAIERLLNYKPYISSRTILTYRALKDELDVSEFCKRALSDGKRIAFPVCDGKGGMVAAICGDCEDAIQIDRYGIAEPRLAYASIVMPGELDFVLVPGVAFDKKCRRIGWGAGYYDRFLPLCKNATICAVAFEEQILDEVHADPWDKLMDAVATDCELYIP